MIYGNANVIHRDFLCSSDIFLDGVDQRSVGFFRWSVAQRA